MAIHYCGENLEKRTVPVNEKILGGYRKGYPVNYCSICDVYTWDNRESKNPEIIGDIITQAQAHTNLRENGSIYNQKHRNKIAKNTKNL